MAIKAHRAQLYNEKVLIVGVDIAKHQHVAVAEGPEGRSSKPFAFANSHVGFCGLLTWIQQQLQVMGVETMVLGMEPTGHYWRPLAEWLLARGYQIQLVSPLHTHRAKELLDGSPLKSDTKDARVIADLVRQGRCRQWVVPQEVYQQLRYLADWRRRLVEERAMLLNRLHRVMDLLFPELLPLFGRLDGLGLHAVLRVAPTPAEVRQLGLERLTEVLRRHSRGHLGQTRAQAILDAAMTSIGCSSGANALRWELQAIQQRMAELAWRRDEIEGRMAALLDEIDYAQLLLSIPGIGVVTVAVMLGELGDLRGYHNARQVLKMAGLNLYETSSGQKQGNKHITKRGRPHLRQILYMTTVRMMRHGRPLRELVVRAGKTRPTVPLIVAGMRRLLRAMFAMVRDNCSFVQGIFLTPALPRAAQAA